MDCLSFLVLIGYYSYVGCQHWERLGEGVQGTFPIYFFATSYESVIISQKVFKPPNFPRLCLILSPPQTLSCLITNYDPSKGSLKIRT